MNRYLKIAFAVLLPLALSLSAEARSIKYLLNCYSNDNMSEGAFNIYNSTVLINGRWKPAPSNEWYAGDLLAHNLNDGTYFVNFLRLADFYVPPIETRVVANDDLGYTNWYHIYSNSLTIAVTGISGSASAFWRLTSYPANEYTNSSTYLVNSNNVFSNTYTLSTIPTGFYNIAFDSVRGHQSPPATNIAVSSAAYNLFSTNTYIPYSNSLGVVVTGVNGTNVIWTLSSYPGDYTNALIPGTSFTNNYTLAMIPTGSYTVTFPALSGYTAPSPQSANVVGALSPAVTGAYSRIFGHLRITMTPDYAGSNAPWILTTYPSDFTVYTNKLNGTGNYTYSNIPIGAYTVTFDDLTGYNAPAPASGTVYSNSTTTLLGEYTFDGFTLTVFIGAPLNRQNSLAGIGSGSLRIEYNNGIVSTQTAAEATYAVFNDTTVTLTALTNFVYRWYYNNGGTAASGIDGSYGFTNSYSFTMTETKGIWLLYSTPYYSYDNVGDLDHDLLPDRWEVAWFTPSSWILETTTPQSEISTNTYANGDNDFIPSASTNPPMQISIDSNGIATITGLGGSTPAYPLGRDRLIRVSEVSAFAGTIGYSTGVKFHNLFEARGLDGYYLTNGPSGSVPNDDPLTDPTIADTDGDTMTDGWEYYFWYWRSADAYSAGLSNSFNLSWVTLSPTEWDDPEWDTDGDGILDALEHGQTALLTYAGLDPTHCDTDNDSMDDYFETFIITPNLVSNALDYANNWGNQDGDYMAWASQGMLATGTVGTALGTNVFWVGGAATNPSAAWNEIYTNSGAGIFDLYKDTILKASVALTNRAAGARYAQTNYYGTNAAAGAYKNGYPVWVDMDTNGVYSAGDVALVNPALKHDGVYCMAPAFPCPGVCSFDPRTAWTNSLPGPFGVPLSAPHTIPYTTYQEYLGGDYLGRLSWDAGGLMSVKNDETFALNRNSYTLPHNQDTDNELMPDGWELYTGLNPNSSADAGADPDGDSLNNLSEWSNASHPLGSCALTWPNKPWPTDPGVIAAPAPNDPHPKDTDWDGLVDGYTQDDSSIVTNNVGELISLSNPTQADTDEDFLPDAWEVYAGTSITNSDANLDADHDGLRNWQEYWTGTVPEWMLCDSVFWERLYFAARRLMDWDSVDRLTGAGATNMRDTFGGTDGVDTRWFIPPDFLTCPSFLYYNNVVTSLDQLRVSTNFPASASLGCLRYHTTFANDTDSDDDGMDDFWEVFHCLNPIRGQTDLNYGVWDEDRQGPNMMTGGYDADTTQPGNQVGLAGAPFTNAMDLVNYWKALRKLTSAASQEDAVIAIVGPHNFGLVGMDPDGDGLANSKEYEVHTFPSPLWRTDQYQYLTLANSPYYFASQNYTKDNTYRAGGWENFNFNAGFSQDGDAHPLPFRWASKSEGFDTDNDLISDYAELTGYRQGPGGVVAGTDPLNDESPLHNRVLWLDGTNSWLCSSKWHHIAGDPYGDFTKFSVEAWVRPSRLSSALDQVVVEKTSSYYLQSGSGALANFQLGISSNGVPYILFHGLNGFTTNRATAAYVPGQMQVDHWTHLAGVFDGSNLILYVNGEVSTTHRATDVPAHGDEQSVTYFWPYNNLSIGAREYSESLNRSDYFVGAAANFFGGCIDEVRVWDRVLSAGEIKARKDRRLTPAEVGTVFGGNNPYAQSTNNLFAYYRFTDLPDPSVEGIAPSEFPTNRPPFSWIYSSYSRVYTNYLVFASDRVKRVPRLPPLDTRVISSAHAPLGTNAPDAYGIPITNNYLGITLPAGFRNSANPFNFLEGNNLEVMSGMWLLGNAQGLKTNIWLATLDPNDPDSTDSDGDGLPDWWEQLYGLDIYDATGINGAWGDADLDGLNNLAEYRAGTSPRMSDTDGDGISDYDSHSGPYTRTDGELYTDGDGMPDDWEVTYGLDPFHYDAQLDKDLDGWSNLSEYLAGTNPNDSTSYPQPFLWGTADYFGNRSGALRFFVYNTNTMDGVPRITTVGAGQQVAETIGTANGTVNFSGGLPIYPIDPSTVVAISAPLTNNQFIAFTFTGPGIYTYSGQGSDYNAILDYNTGRLTLRWASIEVPLFGASVSVAYTYVNRNAAAFNLSGFHEGDFWLMALMDLNNNQAFDPGEPMGIMEEQPLTMSYSTLLNTKVHVKDSAPGYGRFAWTASASGTSDYPMVINKVSAAGAPTVLARTVRWSRNFAHEWDYQIAGLYGLPSGNYQWWMNSQQGTFSITWPASVSTPNLVFPRGDALNYARNRFKWTMDANSTMYHLQVARQASDRGLAFVLDQYYPIPYSDANGVYQAYLPLYAGELGNGIYYWRVAGWSPAGESAWSDAQTFEINLNATNSYSITGDIYYFGKADSSNIIVEAFDNAGFGGKPDARVLLTGASRTNNFKGTYTLRGLQAGTYYVRAWLDVIPAGGTRNGKLDNPWESVGFVRDPNNSYVPRALALFDTTFIDDAKVIIRDHDTDNDFLPDAWEMFYFGNLEQTGDMDYDGDGETNLEEYQRDGYDLNPTLWDSDGDNLSDAFETSYLPQSFGFAAKSGQTLNPNVWDTDGDGYSDGAELYRYHTDPLDPNDYPRYQPMCFDAFRSPGDYDGDGRTDLGVYDVNSGNWYLMTAGGAFFNLPFGNSATQPMLGDYDGDGYDDFALYEAVSGSWYLYNAWTGQSYRLNFGDSEMIPVPADYDGDQKTDLAVYYPAEGMWFVYSAWSGQFYSLQHGGPTWIPVPGDYNNDGASDLAVYEPASGNWNIFVFNHYSHQATYYSGNFGGPTWAPAPGDYDGDGRYDAALFEQNTGNWSILTWTGQAFQGRFGGYGCIPAPGDYDGDGRTDVCVYYPPTGAWYIYCWSGQTYQAQFGWPAAAPVLKGR